jgi:LPXTG-motif cell wall-anchored protein
MTYFLVGAGVLLAVGIALLVLMRRRGESTEDA